MTLPDILKLAAAVLLIVAGVLRYRKRARDPDSRYGSQSAILLLTVGMILAVVALGGLKYRPSPAEIEAASQ